jgi:diacylglycerol kinase family enzyme
LLDVVVVKKPPLPLLPWTAQLLFFKNFDMSIYVDTYKAKKVKVFNEESIGVNIDGEYMEFNEDLEFEVIPSSLKVIVK